MISKHTVPLFKNGTVTECSVLLILPPTPEYCIKNNHWSIFEMGNIIFEIKGPRDILRQILRHRSFTFQEFSQRYAVVETDPFIRDARSQDSKNRQNSIVLPEDDARNAWFFEAQHLLHEQSQRLYHSAIEKV